MVEYLNQHVAGHILTLEDPIEYRYTSQRCLIHQREVGVHCASFAAGLRGALREDPDVILLGELRDAETIRLALTAAETGHLVLATLHTRGRRRPSRGWWIPFPHRRKIRCVISWQTAYGRYFRKSWRKISWEDAWRYLSCSSTRQPWAI